MKYKINIKSTSTSTKTSTKMNNIDNKRVEIIHEVTITGTSLSGAFDKDMSKLLGRGYLPCDERVITEHDKSESQCGDMVYYTPKHTSYSQRMCFYKNHNRVLP